ADGKSSKDTDTSVILGTAYRNTSFVIYEQTVHGLSDSAFEPNRSLLETTVITHEFGHILGLTNLGTTLQSNHEDTEHPKHCIEKTCLMFWSAEIGGGIGNMVSSGSAPQLDAQCIADLRANGGK
ncbi:membrane metalloprotease, partial [Flavobacterium sp. XS1P32]